MSQPIQAIRGMNDILPDQTEQWRSLEKVLRRIVTAYGYREIRLPLLEKTELFQRSIGEVTDIVEKEMYTFPDRSGDSLTLRPEGTAGCVRAGIEHGLFYNQTQRLWYIGPMFRHERPQKGRYRQFQQLGVEAFGMLGPDIDAELIFMTARFWRELKLEQELTLHLNSLGSADARAEYRKSLVDYFKARADQLDDDSKRRLQTNPLRILDSKNPAMQTLLAEAPCLLDCLDIESKQHFDEVRKLLDKAHISYTINPRLVRGLDYYNKTVFEWMTSEVAAQNTVCAGGRYDSLVEELGGQATPAVGFAMGLERLLALCALHRMRQVVHAYFIMGGEDVRGQGFILAERLRDAIPKLRLIVDCAGGGFKNQFKRADKSGAQVALVLGEDELKTGMVTVKYLREERSQEIMTLENLINYLSQLI